MSNVYAITGGVDMKNKQKSQIKSREAAKQNRFNQWSSKREDDLKAIDREKPLTYKPLEIFIVNKSKGYIEHRDLKAENRERR